ncbi:MAG: DegT/DnrJ/EryC1/StrS family aminotransferase [Zetaproteobacteria bacterium]|nr:DegT/DnrJ/EryC1/StrS family aminotransferase [Zetaproteobacteria bacterium]
MTNDRLPIQSEIDTLSFQNVAKGIEKYFEQNKTPSFSSAAPQVRLHEPTYGADEVIGAIEPLLTTRVTMGQKVEKFEQGFGEIGYKHVVSVNSGSSANLLAVAAVSNPAFEGGLRPGDEVLVPALCWSTTVWPLIQCGLVPVIVDIDLETLNIDLDLAAKACSPKTKGIMPVHVYGNPCQMDKMLALAEQKGLHIIEDACESMGATFDGKPVGSFGIIGTFSTYFSHHITTLEGGLCVTESADCAEMLRVLRAHGWVRDSSNKDHYCAQNPEIDPKFLFVNTGYNLRLTEVQAAMGIRQLPKLSPFVSTRQKNAAYFREQLEPYSNFFHFQKTTPKAEHSWFGFPIMVKESAPFKAKDITIYLNQAGIETRPLIGGNILRQPAMKLYPHRAAGNMPNSDLAMNNGFTFGNHQGICDQARAYIVDKVDEFMRRYAV